jgi:uncharacterized OB-fold protein
MSDYKKPLPRSNSISMPFWEAAKHHELQIQRCNSCGTYVFYPREACAECLSSDLSWVKISGRGTIYSYTVAYAPTHPAFSGDVPYVIAIIELAEGPRIITNIVGCKIEAVKIGMPVEVIFDDVTQEITLIKFKPA